MHGIADVRGMEAGGKRTVIPYLVGRQRGHIVIGRQAQSGVILSHGPVM